jgi:hypothetical protein
MENVSIIPNLLIYPQHFWKFSETLSIPEY